VVKQEVKEAAEETKRYKPDDKLWTYWSDKESKLRDQLNKLREQLTELSREKNLLLQQQQQGQLPLYGFAGWLLAAGEEFPSLPPLAWFY